MPLDYSANRAPDESDFTELMRGVPYYEEDVPSWVIQGKKPTPIGMAPNLGAGALAAMVLARLGLKGGKLGPKLSGVGGKLKAALGKSVPPGEGARVGGALKGTGSALGKGIGKVPGVLGLGLLAQFLAQQTHVGDAFDKDSVVGRLLGNQEYEIERDLKSAARTRAQQKAWNMEDLAELRKYEEGKEARQLEENRHAFRLSRAEDAHNKRLEMTLGMMDRLQQVKQVEMQSLAEILGLL